MFVHVALKKGSSGYIGNKGCRGSRGILGMSRVKTSLLGYMMEEIFHIKTPNSNTVGKFWRKHRNYMRFNLKRYRQYIYYYITLLHYTLNRSTGNR